MKFQRLIILGLIIGLSSATLKLQSPFSGNQNHDSVPVDAVIALTEDGLMIRILSDGTVLVVGETFDYDIGRIKMQIDRNEVMLLIDEFARINYFALPDRYYDRKDGCLLTGAPATFIAITITLSFWGHSKSVTHLPYECLEADGSPYPRELVALEKRIEQAVDLRRRR